MTHWQVLPTISASMPFQLALDEVLLEHSIRTNSITRVAPIFRFYFSDSPWVSLGYSRRGFRRSYAYAQNPRDYFKNMASYPAVRRITGGGRVLHKEDLIFSLVADKESDPSFASVRISYLKIHEAVQLALKHCGIETRFYRCDENLPKGEDCFRFPIATDLAWGKKKIAGGAQKRTRGILLHQESVACPRKVDPFDLILKIRSSLEQIFLVQLIDSDIDPDWMRQAGQLAKAKYESEHEIEAKDAPEMSEQLL